MKGPPHLALWGTSHGFSRTLLPEVRLLTALAGLIACLVVDTASWPGLLLLVATVLLTGLCVAPPLRPLLSVLLIGLVMLAPLLLLAPFSEGTMPRHALPGIARVAAPWRVLLTGLGVLAITTTTLTSLTRSDLREALARLPIPRLLSAIVLQIVMQTDLLTRETGRILLALRGRGATQGFANRLRIAAALPRVWLLRLTSKADRVASAMEARGFPTRPLTLVDHHWRLRDALALGLALGWAIAAALVRIECVP